MKVLLGKEQYLKTKPFFAELHCDLSENQPRLLKEKPSADCTLSFLAEVISWKFEYARSIAIPFETYGLLFAKTADRVAFTSAASLRINERTIIRSFLKGELQQLRVERAVPSIVNNHYPLALETT